MFNTFGLLRFNSLSFFFIFRGFILKKKKTWILVDEIDFGNDSAVTTTTMAAAVVWKFMY